MVDSLLEILKPLSKKLNYISYKQVSNDKQFSTLADAFIEKTSLTYKKTQIKRLDYTSENFQYTVKFSDSFDIVLTYYLNANKHLEKIIINNTYADKSIYYSFAQLYSKYILIDQLQLNKVNVNHDVSLIHRNLQYPSDEKYRSKNVLINTVNDQVTISINTD